ncbi:MAG: response regulator, partial [Alphaproteobacteria bacterium]|nr:response regulator [Alphaproteobacteria bacterium]
MKILIVDDHQTMRNVVSNLLQRLGFQNIDEAADGTEALKILRANSQYGLIITDWNMKPMSGLQLL